jgi:flagellar biosynthetic protein FliQ
MSEGALLDLWRHALITVVAVAAPFLIAALVVGLVTSLIQAATQLQESVLSFVPKIVAVALVIVLAGPWVLGRLTRFTGGAVARTADVGRVAGR